MAKKSAGGRPGAARRRIVAPMLVATLAATPVATLAGCGTSPLRPELPGYSANGLERGAGAAAEPGPVSVGVIGTGPAGNSADWGPEAIGPAAVGPGAVGPGPVGQGAVGGYAAY